MNKLKSQLYLYELIDPDGEVYVTENLLTLQSNIN
jgi:hypothetical protein